MKTAPPKSSHSPHAHANAVEGSSAQQNTLTNQAAQPSITQTPSTAELTAEPIGELNAELIAELIKDNAVTDLSHLTCPMALVQSQLTVKAVPTGGSCVLKLTDSVSIANLMKWCDLYAHDVQIVSANDGDQTIRFIRISKHA